jgi:hypothetical protein
MVESMKQAVLPQWVPVSLFHAHHLKQIATDKYKSPSTRE